MQNNQEQAKRPRWRQDVAIILAAFSGIGEAATTLAASYIPLTLTSHAAELELPHIRPDILLMFFIAYASVKGVAAVVAAHAIYANLTEGLPE